MIVGQKGICTELVSGLFLCSVWGKLSLRMARSCPDPRSMQLRPDMNLNSLCPIQRSGTSAKAQGLSLNPARPVQVRVSAGLEFLQLEASSGLRVSPQLPAPGGGAALPCPGAKFHAGCSQAGFGLAFAQPRPASGQPSGRVLRKVRSQGNAREGLGFGGTPYPYSSCANTLLMVPHGVSWLAPSHCEKLTNSQTLTPICKLVEEM